MGSTDSSATQANRERRLQEILEAFEAEARSGHVPNVQGWADRYPEFAEEILDLFPGLLLMEHTAKTWRGNRPVEAPEQLGPYRIVRELGRGGMGVVYLAEEQGLERRVALKVLDPGRLRSAGAMERFLRESKAAGALRHPHVVPVFASGQEEDWSWYAMQFVDGFALDHVLARLGPASSGSKKSSSTMAALLQRIREEVHDTDSGERDAPRSLGLDPREACRIAREIGQALVHAHTQGVLHRDIKPANVLLDGDGHAWVTDFGLCRLEGDASLTQDGDVVGTLRYMAPESLEGEGDERSDLYGAGLVLYEMLVGRPAFPEERRARLVKAILTQDPPKPTALQRSIPRDLETIVLKAIAKEPAMRYPSAAAFVRDLEHWEAGRPIEARTPSAWYGLSLFFRRQRWLATSLVLSVLVVAGLVGLYTHRLAQKERARAQDEYIARVTAAEAALSTGSPVRALEQLQLAEASLRGWEWRHLHALTDQSVWSAATGRPYVRELAFSPSGGFLLSAGVAGGMLWKESDGSLERVLEVEGNAYDLTWGPTDSEGWLLFDNGRVVKVDATRGSIEERSEWQTPSPIQSSTVLPDGRLLVGTFEGEVACWDPATGAWELLLLRPAPIAAVGILTSGEVWATDQRGWNAQWRLGEDPWEGPTFGIGQGGFAQRSDDGRWMAVALAGRPPFVLAMPKEVLQGALVQALPSLREARFSPNSQRLAGGGNDRRLMVWDVETGQVEASLLGHAGRIMSLAWHPDGQRIASGDDLGTIRLWTPFAKGGDRILGHHQSDVFAMAVSKKRLRALTGSRDGTAQVWNIESGERIATLWTPARAILETAWTAGANQGLVGMDDGSVVLWDVESDQERRVLPATALGRTAAQGLAASETATSFFVAGARDGRTERQAHWVEEWDRLDWQFVRRFDLGDHTALTLQWDEVEQVIWVLTQASRLLRIDLASGQVQELANLSDSGRKGRIEIHPKSQRAIFFDGSERVLLLELGSKVRWTEWLVPQDSVQGAAFLDGGGRVALSTRQGRIEIWDPVAGRALVEVGSIGMWAMSLGATSDGESLLAGDSKGNVYALDTLTSADRSERLRRMGHWPPDPKRLPNADQSSRKAAHVAWEQAWSGTYLGVRSARYLAPYLADACGNHGLTSAANAAALYLHREWDSAWPHLEEALKHPGTPRAWLPKLRALRFWAQWRRGEHRAAWQQRSKVPAGVIQEVQRALLQFDRERRGLTKK